MMKTLSLLIIAGSLPVAAARAEVVSFPRIWKDISAQSAAQSAARLKADAAEEARARSSRHWLPRLYLDSRVYRSNDPGAAFAGLLEQRALSQPDFNPNAINHPGAATYSRAALGVDMPLFQGGAPTAFAQMMDAGAAAEAEGAKQTEIQQYAEVGKAYASITAIDRGLLLLREMQAQVRELNQSYRLGSKANPVGYSGALGMKALGQRLAAIVQQYAAQKSALAAQLKELGVRYSQWAPEPLPATEFVDRFLPMEANTGPSHRLESLRWATAMSESAVGAERGRFLPQVGAFAEGYGFRGSRDTATGYSAGLYLRWNLFDPGDYGKVTEAKLKAAGAEQSFLAAGQDERAEKQGLSAGREALRSNLAILGEMEKVLREQARVTETLFKNGSINALQLVEVVSRRADLSVQKMEAELNYLGVSARAFSSEKKDIDKLIEE